MHFITADEGVYSLKAEGPLDVGGGVYPPS